MTSYGYTLLCEQSAPTSLVRDAAAAERAGFSFEVMSDHISPWLDSQGHAPAAWPLLGAVATVTESVELMTYVTCPTVRYHPVVVAQQAATVALLSGGRFRLGLGAGENLNEHVVGRGWPAVATREEMLAEALEIIGRLFDGGYVTYRGEHFRTDGARVWDLPEQRVPIGVAVSGPVSARHAAEGGQFLIAVEPKAELVEAYRGAGGAGDRVAQVPISWDRDKDAAVARAHDEFRWFGGGWKVNADLPGTAGFEAASQYVTPADVAESIPCGPEIGPIVEAIRAYEEAGFSHVAVAQIGGESQTAFLEEGAPALLEALRG